MKFADREVEGYSLFKTGIRPEWEDEANKYGGEIFCRKTFKPRDFDEIYETLLLGLIEETIYPEDEVCGCRIVDKNKGGRPAYRVEVWFRSQGNVSFGINSIAFESKYVFGCLDGKQREVIQNNVRSCLRRHILTEFRAHGDAMSSFLL